MSLTTDGTDLFGMDGCGIRKVTLASGATSTITNTVSGTHITYGSDNYLYVSGGNTLKKVDPSNGTATTVATVTNGSAGGVAADSSYVWWW